VVKVEGELRLRVPLLNLESIICFGRPSLSTELLCRCGESAIPISVLNSHGRFRARVTGGTHGNVLLRRAQYRASDQAELACGLARSFVAAKILNSRVVLQRALRDHPEMVGVDAVRASGQRLKALAPAVAHARDIATLRGVEGEAGRTYFAAFDAMILVDDEPGMRFLGRSRRPPLDAPNALLSFLYTLLAHDMAGAVEAVGLDPAVGFLHRDRPGRPSLALDVLEEFRGPVADRLALSLINRHQIGSRSFKVTESGAVHLEDEPRKVVLGAYQQRKLVEVRHPFLNEKMPLGFVPHMQARLLARHLRGDLDAYPPFLWR